MTEVAASARKQWPREEIAEKLDEFEEGYARLPSQRHWAEDLGIPRSTLQYWLEQKETINADPALVAFFESSVGVAFLHRLILAAHLVMTLVGPCGIRLVCLFLELTGLDQFVAASYGPQHQVSAALEKAVVEFGQAERQRLAVGMRPKEITVCEDALRAFIRRRAWSRLSRSRISFWSRSTPRAGRPKNGPTRWSKPPPGWP